MTKTAAKAKTKPKTKRRANPNNANQFKPDPRQAIFLALYLDPKSKTFSNGYQSAVKAGYKEDYAKVLTATLPTWLKEQTQDNYMISLAQDNLREFLEMDTKNEVIDKHGEKVVFDDPKIKKIKADVTKFTLERLHKEKYSQHKTVKHEGGLLIGSLDLSNEPEALKTILKTAQAVLSNIGEEA